MGQKRLPRRRSLNEKDTAMALKADSDEFPAGFITDAAISIRTIETLTTDAAELAAAPLDPERQERMRRSLEVGTIERANAAAQRIVRLPRGLEGLSA
jgi:hypothetical protein